MNHRPKPDTATATFIDGPLTVRLTIPAQDAAAWRTATTAAILGHLGLGDTDPVGAQPGDVEQDVWDDVDENDDGNDEGNDDGNDEGNDEGNRHGSNDGN